MHFIWVTNQLRRGRLCQTDLGKKTLTFDEDVCHESFEGDHVFFFDRDITILRQAFTLPLRNQTKFFF